MDSRGHQYSHRIIQKGRPNGQCIKIQYHALPARENLHRDVRSRFQTENHRRGDHTPGVYVAEHYLYGLRGGVDGRSHYGPLHMIEWDIAGN